MVDCQLPAPVTELPALVTSENKILKIDSKWSETRKKNIKPATLNFCRSPVGAATGG